MNTAPMSLTGAVRIAFQEVWVGSLTDLEECLSTLHTFNMHDLVALVKMKIVVRKVAMMLELNEKEAALYHLYGLKLWSKDGMEEFLQYAPEQVPKRKDKDLTS